jgi:hypothetical protein
LSCKEATKLGFVLVQGFPREPDLNWKANNAVLQGAFYSKYLDFRVQLLLLAGKP